MVIGSLKSVTRVQHALVSTVLGVVAHQLVAVLDVLHVV